MVILFMLIGKKNEDKNIYIIITYFIELNETN
jgi:hypothetical protein